MSHAGCLAALLLTTALTAQTPAHKKLLALGEEKGFRHQAVSHALATIERLGRESGLWDTTIRTDTEALTRQKLEYNAPNLNDFDAVLFYTGGNLEMTAAQKAQQEIILNDCGPLGPPDEQAGRSGVLRCSLRPIIIR